MPDLANRLDIEQRLTDVLALVYDGIAAQGIDVDWAAAEEAVRDAMLPELVVIWDAAGEAMGEVLDAIAPEDAKPVAVVAQPAPKEEPKQLAAEVAKQVIANRKDVWAKAAAEVEKIDPPQDEEPIARDALLLYLLYGLPRRRTADDVGGFEPLRGGVLKQMSPGLQNQLVSLERYELSDAWRAHLAEYVPPGGLASTLNRDAAERTAVTTTTGANSQSERKAADDFEKRTGVKVVAYWVTERDSRVCKTCQALGGQPERVWLSEFPDGPPAHVNCRCWLSWDVE